MSFVAVESVAIREADLTESLIIKEFGVTWFRQNCAGAYMLRDLVTS